MPIVGAAKHAQAEAIFANSGKLEQHATVTGEAAAAGQSSLTRLENSTSDARGSRGGQAGELGFFSVRRSQLRRVEGER
jgi:hypothetical protein